MNGDSKPHRLCARGGAAHLARAEPGLALQSQANVAGYKAVLLGGRQVPAASCPMLMTAAGTVKAARVVILGVGVAGLQAIATASAWVR